MPRSFDMTADYQGSVEDVFRAFADADYWHGRLAVTAADETALEALRAADESDLDAGIDVVTLQVIHSQRLPGVVTQVHRGDLGVRREESWGPISDGSATASLSGEILGAPATLSGTASLSRIAGSGGCRMAYQVSVQVRIPLIGGKIEKFIGAQLVGVVQAEQRFTASWIVDRA
jgi:Protein of unknown function (DUF2505)